MSDRAKRKCAGAAGVYVDSDEDADDIRAAGGTFESKGYRAPFLRPIAHDRYATELFYDDREDADFLRVIGNTFTNMQRVFFEHLHGRTRGRRPTATSYDAIPMHLEYSAEVWKLFFGDDRSEKPVAYTDIDAVLLNKRGHDAMLSHLKRARLEFHREFLAEREFAHVLVDDVVWRVTRAHPVPWMIPVQFSWYNNRAVPPSSATLSEMFECSRIEDTNRILFEKDFCFKHLLQHLIFMEKHVMFDAGRAEVNTPCSLAVSWFKPNYVFFKRCFKVLVLYDETIQWSMFLAFEKKLVDDNLDKIIVPKDTVIASLDGEVRPLDLFQMDLYALELIRACLKGWYADKEELKKADISYLVTTFFCAEDRPAVGGSGFFANATCVDDVWFCCMSHWLDSKRTGTVISNSQNSYRHSMITTSVDITGGMIKRRNWEVAGLENLYLLPVEWQYSQSSSEDSTKQIVCNCMTRCHGKSPDSKNKIRVSGPPQRERPDAEWTTAKVESIETLCASKKSGIQSYIEHFNGSGS